MGWDQEYLSKLVVKMLNQSVFLSGECQKPSSSLSRKLMIASEQAEIVSLRLSSLSLALLWVSFTLRQVISRRCQSSTAV